MEPILVLIKYILKVHETVQSTMILFSNIYPNIASVDTGL